MLHVPATDHKPFQVLVTAGMSSQTMEIPEEQTNIARNIELMLGLPADWPLEDPSPTFVWPLKLLLSLARFPFTFEGGWLSVGHTIPNGQPMCSYDSSTQLCCALVAPPLSVSESARRFATETKDVHLLALVPLFEHEVTFKLEEGTDALLQRLDQHRVNEVLNPTRRAVAGTLLDLMDTQGHNS